MWRWQFSKRLYGTAMTCGLGLLVGTTGCVPLKHHLTRHTPVHDLKRNPGYYHCAHCGQIIDDGVGHQCAIELPYHGYQPTCWTTWPQGWPDCPTVIEEKLLPAEVLPGADWEPTTQTHPQLPMENPSARLVENTDEDATMQPFQPVREFARVAPPQPGSRFRQGSVIVLKESLPTPMVQPTHAGQQILTTEPATRSQRVATWPTDSEPAMPSENRSPVTTEPSSEATWQNETPEPAQLVLAERQAGASKRTVSLTLAEAVARWLPESTPSTSSQTAKAQAAAEDGGNVERKVATDTSPSAADADSTGDKTSIADNFEVVIPVPKNNGYKSGVEPRDEELAVEDRTSDEQPAREDELIQQPTPTHRKPTRRPTLVETLWKLGRDTTTDRSSHP